MLDEPRPTFRTARADVLVLCHQNFAGRDEPAGWDAWTSERFA